MITIKQQFTRVLRPSIKLLLILSFLITFSQTIYAQSDEEDEDESGFFSDGISGGRFESSFDNSHITEKPQYQVRSSKESNNNSEDINYQNYKELDVEVHKLNTGAYGGGSGGGGSSSGTPGVNNTNNAPTGVNNSFGGTPSIKQPNLGVPINPDDPDVPIDGGVSLLLGVGAAYGLKILRKKKLSLNKQNHSL